MKIVIKVGTSTLSHPTGLLNIRHMEMLCKVMSDLKNQGHRLILVSSGAIGMGVGKLSLGARPADTETKQAAAAVGQCELMYTYDKLFSEYRHIVAQLLLTGKDILDPSHRENFQKTVERLLSLGVLPIINENDTVAVDEIMFGDNDTLAAYVAEAIGADLLILLSDIDGLFSADPHTDPSAELIPVVRELNEDIRRNAGGSGSELGTGGMTTKIRAAQIVTNAGIDMIITNGSCPENLYKIVEGENVGTRFLGKGKNEK